MNVNASFAMLGIVFLVGCGPAAESPSSSDRNFDARTDRGGKSPAGSRFGGGAGANEAAVGSGASAGASGAWSGAAALGGAAGDGSAVDRGNGGVTAADASSDSTGAAVADTSIESGSEQSEICNPAAGDSGAFTVLTYNVAGLPEGISQSHPQINLQLISPLLNGYDVVLVQENFTFLDYPQRLRSAASHRFKSTPKPAAGGTDLGDGLNYFSELCFEHKNLHREPWKRCFGHFSNANDCLTSKGFAVVEMHLAQSIAIDVYDLHMDAGGAAADVAARAAQVDQLLARIASQSVGRAIILAGDTNMGGNEAALAKLLRDAKMTDSCRALSCGDERIDRILFRSSRTVELTPSKYRIASEFVDRSRRPLSDHEAVAVDFAWQIR